MKREQIRQQQKLYKKIKTSINKKKKYHKVWESENYNYIKQIFFFSKKNCNKIIIISNEKQEN